MPARGTATHSVAASSPWWNSTLHRERRANAAGGPPRAGDAGNSAREPCSTCAPTRLRSKIVAGLFVLAAVVSVPVAHPVQPPGDAAAELAASGSLDAALTLLDGWLAEHPGDARLFPVVLQVVTAAPERRTVDAVLKRYGESLAAKNVGVLRAVPADWAELRGGVEQALDALRGSRLPDAERREAVLLMELGQMSNQTRSGVAPIAVHAGLARAGQGLNDSALEEALRTAFGAGAHGDGGADGAVAGYGLVVLLSAVGRSSEAVAVLAEMGRRYPRSPEYALAAAELRSAPVPGSTAAPVVALPSPAMLLGGVALACPAPCTIPAALLQKPPAPAAASNARQASATRPAPSEPDAQAPRPPQAQPAGQGTHSQTTAAERQGERPPDRIELVPARVPVDADTPRRGGEMAPSPSAELPTATEDRRRDNAAKQAVESHSTPSDRPVAAATRPSGRGGASAAAAMHAARQAADRLPRIAEDPVSPAPAGGTGATRRTEPRTGVTDGAHIRVSSAPGVAANDTWRSQTDDSRELIRVTAQPANRPSLSSDRVFVATESRTGDNRRPHTVRETTASARSGAIRTSTAATASGGTARSASVRVASLPDPAAFIVQVGAYVDPDNALAMELQLRRAGFTAVARSYRNDDGTIVHRVDVGGNVTRAKGERVLALLSDAGFDPYISRRDVVSYLPPEPRHR